jgi:phosphatidylglycerol:prolipoprotein diacylglycerol transferase
MLFPHLDPVALHLGPIDVRWYGIAYVAGVLLGWLYARKLVGDQRLWGRKFNPISVAELDDLPIWIMAGIIFGGRMGYAIFYQPDHFFHQPMAFFRLWDGGMSFHGGMIGATAAIALFAVKRHIAILSLLDVVASAAPIGLFFGRLANFVNGELYGRPSTLPWAIIFPGGGPMPRHPSQIYEAILEGALLFFVLALLIYRGRSLRFPGLTGGVFLALYGLARILVEDFREPDPQLGFLSGGVTMGMVLSGPMVILGLAIVAFTVVKQIGKISSC